MLRPAGAETLVGKLQQIPHLIVLAAGDGHTSGADVHHGAPMAGFLTVDPFHRPILAHILTEIGPAFIFLHNINRIQHQEFPAPLAHLAFHHSQGIIVQRDMELERCGSHQKPFHLIPIIPFQHQLVLVITVGTELPQKQKLIVMRKYSTSFPGDLLEQGAFF